MAIVRLASQKARLGRLMTTVFRVDAAQSPEHRAESVSKLGIELTDQEIGYLHPPEGSPGQ